MKNIFRRSVCFKLFALLLALCLTFGMTACSSAFDVSESTKEEGKKTEDTADTTPAAPESETEPEVDTEPKEPHPIATASVGVIGDILIHETVYNSAKRSDGSYDFTENYVHVASYLKKYDYTVANLEVTLGGENPSVGTYPSAYPLFNCPDSVVDALKGAGVDMLLTANNHSYDTRTAGLLRTVEVVRDKGLDYLGTRDTTDESFFKVKDINGIKIGMACFTYSTMNSSGVKALNGITMTAESSPLVCSFTYENLPAFYLEAENAIAAMRADGAEFIMFYMHWGNEYQYVPTSYQKNMAQKLADLGVDVIVGGHPHVIQPFATLTGEGGNTTYCIYSTGNAISNQRKFLMDSDNYSGHTEDGMIFGVTFEKWSDGRLLIKDVNIEPLWVIRESRGGRLVYNIIPLDLTVDWHNFELTDATIKEAEDSYNRTMKLVGEGLNAARKALGLSEVKTSVR